jgi:hypothetical protein
MAALRLDPSDRYAEIDLVEDSTVDAAELAARQAKGNAIRTCGFQLTVTGRLVLGPRQGYRRGDVAAAIRRRRGR